MGFIDFTVNRFFRDESQGRVFLFDGGVRGQGYLVRSASDEHRIRAFLRMYVSAWFAIQILGSLLVTAWLSSFLGAIGTPTLERELTRAGFFLALYAVVVGLPFLFLFRAYRQAVADFVSPADVVTLSRRPLDRARYVGLAVLALLLTALAVVATVMHVRAH
jgi:hypothetical protein